MIRLKIKYDQIDQTALFKGQKHTFLDLVVFENENGPDQYGQTHTVRQDLGKERRMRGEKSPILGNGKSSIVPAKKPTPATQTRTYMNPPPADNVDEDVPF